MEIKDLLLILIPLVVAMLSSYLTYFFTIKSKRSEAILKFKEEKYSNLLILLQGFIGNTAYEWGIWRYAYCPAGRMVNELSEGNFVDHARIIFAREQDEFDGVSWQRLSYITWEFENVEDWLVEVA